MCPETKTVVLGTGHGHCIQHVPKLCIIAVSLVYTKLHWSSYRNDKGSHLGKGLQWFCIHKITSQEDYKYFHYIPQGSYTDSVKMTSRAQRVCPFSNIPPAWCVMSHLLRQVWLGSISQRYWLWRAVSSLAARGPLHHTFGVSSLFLCNGSLIYLSPENMGISLRNVNSQKPCGDLVLAGKHFESVLV